jgi:5-formyltetrahydrofolate cyclo-ligase
VDDIRAEKDELRARLKAERSALAPADVRAASAAVCRRLDGLDALAGARAIAVYAASRNEIDPAASVERLRSRGAIVRYPRVDGEQLAFVAARADELVPGAFGIAAPPAEAAAVSPEDLDVVLVPAIAFDRSGYRLGYGRGYYDRALAAAPHALRIGLAHAFQIIDTVPRRDGDEPVDLIVTPDGAHATRARPSHTPGEVQS